MSTGTVEITMLDVDLDAEIPCEVDSILAGAPFPCPDSSVARVRAWCPEHGNRTRFVCERHLNGLIHGEVVCAPCLPDTVTALVYKGIL
jgi:hypothetical protein